MTDMIFCEDKKAINKRAKDFAEGSFPSKMER
jgi:hypothetical protein